MLSQAVPFLLAILIAFAADSSASVVSAGRGGDSTTLVIVIAVVLIAASLAFAVGFGLLAAARRRGWTPQALRTALIRSTHLVNFVNLAGFAAIIHLWGWPDFVRYGLGLRKTFLLEELLVILPFLVMDVMSWCGLFPVARSCRLIMTSRGTSYYLWTKARETYGAVLPAALIFWAGNDLARRLLGESLRETWAQLTVLAILGATVVLISPALVLLSFPSRPLPPGPLRSRLEAVARKYRFRFKNILVWDTDGAVFNARLTGILPRFRYVLLTDALITHLDDDEIAAVFGHELGHVYHRHLPLLAFFCLGSLAVIALFAQFIDGAFRLLPNGAGGSAIAEFCKLILMLAATGVYFRLAFGMVSRVLERQADVFGCKSVSCAGENCPHKEGWARGNGSHSAGPGFCRLGIKTYIDALRIVAAENQVSIDQPSWRHGTIASRITFLSQLDSRPDVEAKFQSSVRKLRWLVGLIFAASFTLAFLSGAFDYLRTI